MTALSQPDLSKGAKWALGILTALVLLAFVPSITFKFMRHPMIIEGFSSMGIPHGTIVPIGVVELICLLLFLIPRTAVLGTLLLTGYLGGATLANIIGGTDFIHALVVGLFVWMAAWLRVPELRGLLPFRQTP